MGISFKKHFLFNIVTIFYLIIMTNLAHAYPDFIGIGYTACITCHFNGAGGGALNDYGRGLFASEIAAKPFWNSKVSDDELSQKSGFLGSTPLPYWFRPSIKYRGLNIESNPGSKEFKSHRYYQMQRDIDLHFPMNENQTVLFALNLGSVEKESAADPNKTFSKSLLLSREYYIRTQMSDSLWFYLGFMDKAFGIRHPDHTAINRRFLGLGQNNQVHGFILHYVKDNNEMFLNPFIGNLQQARDLQFPGVSFHYENEPAERWRVGFSLMKDRDSVSLEKNTYALFFKRGIEGGHAVLFETGVKDSLSLSSQRLTSFYLWTQANIRLTRGYFFQTLMEYFKSDVNGLNAENLKFGAGFLMFPLQRLEWRLTGMSTRTVDPTGLDKDNWVMQSQVHLSF